VAHDQAATGGADVAVGDVISTARDGRAVLVRGQEYLVVSPNSRLKVVEPGASGSVTQIFEELGNVVFKIEKKSTPHFGVQTPYLAAVVKGTTFSVTVTDAGASVQVTEGRVEVSSLDGGATQMLTPGMIGMVSRDQPQQLTIDQGDTPAPDAGVAVDAPAAATTSSADVGPQNGQGARIAATSIAAEATTAAPQGAGPVSGQVAGMSGVDPGLVAADASRVSLIANNGHGYAYGQAVAASVSNAGGNGNGVANGLINSASSNAGGNGNGVANGLVNGVGNAGSSNAGGNGNGLANGLINGAGNAASNNAGGNGNGVANGLVGATGNAGSTNAGGNGNGVANGLVDAAGGSGSSNAGGNGNGVANGLVDNAAAAVAQIAASLNGLGGGKKN